MKLKLLLTLAIFCISLILSTSQAKSDLTREEVMLIRLNQGHNSAGDYIAKSYSETEVILQQLNKALTQVDIVSQTYSKTKGKLSDFYFKDTQDNLHESIAALKNLQDKLKHSHKSLRSDVKQALITK